MFDSGEVTRSPGHLQPTDTKSSHGPTLNKLSALHSNSALCVHIGLLLWLLLPLLDAAVQSSRHYVPTPYRAPYMGLGLQNRCAFFFSHSLSLSPISFFLLVSRLSFRLWTSPMRTSLLGMSILIWLLVSLNRIRTLSPSLIRGWRARSAIGALRSCISINTNTHTWTHTDTNTIVFYQHLQQQSSPYLHRSICVRVRLYASCRIIF